MDHADENDTTELEKRVAETLAEGAGIAKVVTEISKGALALIVGFAAEHTVPGAGSAAGIVAKASIDGVLEARRRLADATAGEALQRLSARAPELERNHAALVASGAGSAADVRAIFEQYLAAWAAHGDRRVREMIENAAVNAFDPRRYEEGITRRVLSTLAALDYGAIALLREVASAELRWREWRERRDRGELPEGTIPASLPNPWGLVGSIRAADADALIDQDLILVVNAADVRLNGKHVGEAAATELGHRVLQYIERVAIAKREQDIDSAVARGCVADPLT